MNKTVYKYLLLCLTSSLFIGRSFASNVLDGPEISNRMRASLQNKNAKPLTKEEINRSNPSEYLVRLAIEMILESLRLQEMAKTNQTFDAATALNAGKSMFELRIGAFAGNAPAAKTSPIAKTSPVKADHETNPMPAKKLEQDKNQEEAAKLEAAEEERLRQAQIIAQEEQRRRDEAERARLLEQQKQPELPKDPPLIELPPELPKAQNDNRSKLFEEIQKQPAAKGNVNVKSFEEIDGIMCMVDSYDNKIDFELDKTNGNFVRSNDKKNLLFMGSKLTPNTEEIKKNFPKYKGADNVVQPAVQQKPTQSQNDHIENLAKKLAMRAKKTKNGSSDDEA